jgi:hypothetical protein
MFKTTSTYRKQTQMLVMLSVSDDHWRLWTLLLLGNTKHGILLNESMLQGQRHQSDLHNIY